VIRELTGVTNTITQLHSKYLLTNMLCSRNNTSLLQCSNTVSWATAGSPGL